MRTRHIFVWLITLMFSAVLAGCGGVSQEETGADGQMHKLGVLVYNLADEEVMSFRSYLEKPCPDARDPGNSAGFLWNYV